MSAEDIFTDANGSMRQLPGHPQARNDGLDRHRLTIATLYRELTVITDRIKSALAGKKEKAAPANTAPRKSTPLNQFPLFADGEHSTLLEALNKAGIETRGDLATALMNHGYDRTTATSALNGLLIGKTRNERHGPIPTKAAKILASNIAGLSTEEAYPDIHKAALAAEAVYGTRFKDHARNATDGGLRAKHGTSIYRASIAGYGNTSVEEQDILVKTISDLRRAIVAGLCSVPQTMALVTALYDDVAHWKVSPYTKLETTKSEAKDNAEDDTGGEDDDAQQDPQANKMMFAESARTIALACREWQKGMANHGTVSAPPDALIDTIFSMPPRDKTLEDILSSVGCMKILPSDQQGYVLDVLHTQFSEMNAAKESLIKTELAFVTRLATTLCTRHGFDRHDEADFVQEGNIGLMRAVDRVNAGDEHTFAAYAHSKITGAMRDLLRQKTLDGRKITRYELARSKRVYLAANGQLTHQLGRRPTLGELAKFTGLPIGTVHRFLEGLPNTVSLDSVSAEDGTPLIEIMADNGPGPEALLEQNQLGRNLKALLQRLPEREQQAILAHHPIGEQSEIPPRELATRWGVTESRVSQLYHEGIRRLQRRCRDLVGSNAGYAQVPPAVHTPAPAGQDTPPPQTNTSALEGVNGSSTWEEMEAQAAQCQARVLERIQALPPVEVESGDNTAQETAPVTPEPVEDHTEDLTQIPPITLLEEELHQRYGIPIAQRSGPGRDLLSDPEVKAAWARLPHKGGGLGRTTITVDSEPKRPTTLLEEWFLKRYDRMP